MNETGLTVKDAMTPAEVKGQVNLIQEVMEKTMKDGEHYGKIPGCGDKKALLKPGAEKLLLTFRLAPKYEIVHSVETNDLIMYRVKCVLEHIGTGNFVGSGDGACNSREGKYRWRAENTEKEVPKEYWDNNRDPSIIGGEQYSTKKLNGKWYIMHKVEHDNAWDYQNTILKMACKRALVAAVLNVTAASDIFVQDLDDMDAIPPENNPLGTEPQSEPQRKSQSKPAGDGKQKKEGTATPSQVKMIFAKLKAKGISEEAFKGYMGIESMNDLLFSYVNDALKAIDEGKIPTGDQENAADNDDIGEEKSWSA